MEEHLLHSGWQYTKSSHLEHCLKIPGFQANHFFEITNDTQSLEIFITESKKVLSFNDFEFSDNGEKTSCAAINKPSQVEEI